MLRNCFTIIVLVSVLQLAVNSSAADTVQLRVVSTAKAAGKDQYPSIREALNAARKLRQQGPAAVSLLLEDGTHYLDQTLVLTPADSGTDDSPLVIAAAAGARPLVSGAVRLDVQWQPYQDGILKAQVPAGLAFDQLFVNGHLQHRARYPNYDPNARHFNGTAEDAIQPQRILDKGWKNPTGGFLHAMHRGHWGDLVWRIDGMNENGELKLEGGWQNNRPTPPHNKHRFVANVFEELDAPGEWFLDADTSTLYYYPDKDVDLNTAKLEAPKLAHLIELRGAEDQPVHHIQLRGLKFSHTLHTFMDNKEPLLRSDWTIYRGGAILLEGTEDCSVQDCHIDQVGGNAIFVNKYNRRVEVVGTHIENAGSSGVAFVGDPQAVRSPRFNYNQTFSYEEIDKTPGPQSNSFPADCRVHDCLITRTGRIVKQTAPVQISMSQSITVSHCSIYDVPRAGINISEGTWGGHIIEHCDVFDTVKETGDHGSFNSWGRDRFWHLNGFDNGKMGLGQYKDLPLLDVVKPNIIRNSRWRCDRGWDIDLDDGSSNFQVYNNLCLSGGIKLREGFYRTVSNNIMVKNSFHPHVWYKHSQDTFQNNIVFTPYRPIRVPKPWGNVCDYNLWHRSDAATSPAAKLAEQSGHDQHSMIGDALFLDPPAGDYRVAMNSPAVKLGFKNFPMDKFGVIKPELRQIARTPKLPDVSRSKAVAAMERDKRVHQWIGAEIRNVVGLGDRSAYGLSGESGVIVVNVTAGSGAEKLGLKKDDVIVSVNDSVTGTVADLQKVFQALKPKVQASFKIVRGQELQRVSFAVP